MDTYKQLSEDNNVTKKTIQKWLDSAIYTPRCTCDWKWYIIMDTTYVKWMWWVMTFRLRDIEKKKGKNLLWYRVMYETKLMYHKWIKQLLDSWIEILWITVDGGSWLLWSFWKIPTQMCHFHQKAIIRRNLWKKPKLEQHKELLDIAWWLWRISKKVWIERIFDREKRYSDRLKERNESWWFKHKKARSCIRSLKYHLKYLFVYKENIWMPATSNACEWSFWRLKSKKAIHRGMTIERRKKFINWYLNWT